MAEIFREPFVAPPPPTLAQRYPRDLRTVICTGTFLLLLPGAAPPKPGIHTATTPERKAYPSDLRTVAVNLQERTLFVAPATLPPGKTWTVPVPPRAYPITLRTQSVNLQESTLFIPSRPRQATLPDPTKPAAYPIDLRTTAVNLQLSTFFVAPDTLMGAIWAQPVPPPVYPTSLRTTIVAGLNQTTLFIAPAPIQAPLAEPTKPAPYPTDARTWAFGPPLSLTQAANTPPRLNPQAFGLDSRTPIYPTDLRQWLQSRFTGTPQNYLTRLPNVAPQWTTVYPNNLRTTTVNLLGSTLSVTTAPPFSQQTWFVPPPPVYPANLRTSLFYFVQDENKPQPLLDLTPPPARGYPADLRTWISGNVRLLSLTKPSAQYDWPLTAPAIYPQSLRTIALNLQESTLIVGANLPVGSAFTGTTPGPIYPITLRTQIITSPIPPLPPQPFAQFDWPSPRARVYPSEFRTYLKGMDLRLKGQDTFFGGPGQPPSNHDWPTPYGAAYPGSLRTTIQAANPIYAPAPYWLSRINTFIGPGTDEPDET